MNKLLVIGAAGGAAYYFWPEITSALGLPGTPTTAPTIAPATVATSTATSAQQAGATPLQQATAAQVAATAAAAAVIASPAPPVVSPMSPPADFQRSIVAAGYPVTATNLNWYQWDYLLNAWAGFHAPSASAMGIDPLQPLPLNTFWGAIYPTVASELPGSTAPEPSTATANANAAITRRSVRPL